MAFETDGVKPSRVEASQERFRSTGVDSTTFEEFWDRV
jgi:hypothetical protein